MRWRQFLEVLLAVAQAANNPNNRWHPLWIGVVRLCQRACYVLKAMDWRYMVVRFYPLFAVLIFASGGLFGWAVALGFDEAKVQCLGMTP